MDRARTARTCDDLTPIMVEYVVGPHAQDPSETVTDREQRIFDAAMARMKELNCS